MLCRSSLIAVAARVSLASWLISSGFACADDATPPEQSGTTSSAATDAGPTSASASASSSSGPTQSDSDSTDVTSDSNSSTGDSTTGTTTSAGEDPPPLGPDACDGYATRYWDCCKQQCGWDENVNPETTALESCDQLDVSHGDEHSVVSACGIPAPSAAFTCYNMAPWAVNDSLAYAFAAVPADGDTCGRCYQLEFDGTGHYAEDDPGSVALATKTMIVQATNVGFDVGGGQFDILTPGGGVGAFDACSFQWGVQGSELGATYGGFMTWCQQNVGGTHEELKDCVLERCAAVFDDPVLGELADGCEWYVDWYEAADNPDLKYQEVACPQALIDISGIDRGPLDDIMPCMG